MAREPVLVHIYDINFSMNKFITCIGLGAHHSGVEVYGIEYGYAYHDGSDSGIFNMIPKDVFEFGNQCTFRKSICVGYTTYNIAEVKKILLSLGKEFRGNAYNLISRNCNHFTDSLTKMLCGQNIPKWINRLACVSSYIPSIQHYYNEFEQERRRN